MPRYNLDELDKKFNNLKPSDYRKSREWFAEQAKKLGTRVSQNSILASSDRQRATFQLGKMYLYQYYPIGAKELPYYDSFPLVIPFSAEGMTFTGINFHYLPYKARYVLLRNLLDFASSKRKLDEKTRLTMAWSYLKNAARYPGVEFAVKKYRIDRLQSNFLEIPGNQWFQALLIPVERFNKGENMMRMDKNFVWRDSGVRG